MVKLIERKKITRFYRILEREYTESRAPVKELVRLVGGEPFKVLLCAMLSTRTKDEITVRVCKRLLQLVKTPEDLLKLSEEKLQRLIYPVGFYRQKTKILKSLAQKLIEDYQGDVPNNQEALLKLPGVGRKVANLVLNKAFGFPYIAVDTHVHRICNRLGLVKTKKVEETEKLLHERVPEKIRGKFNELLVALGQTVCKPVKPQCEVCVLSKYCDFFKKRGDE